MKAENSKTPTSERRKKSTDDELQTAARVLARAYLKVRDRVGRLKFEISRVQTHAVAALELNPKDPEVLRHVLDLVGDLMTAANEAWRTADKLDRSVNPGATL